MTSGMIGALVIFLNLVIFGAGDLCTQFGLSTCKIGWSLGDRRESYLILKVGDRGVNLKYESIHGALDRKPDKIRPNGTPTLQLIHGHDNFMTASEFKTYAEVVEPHTLPPSQSYGRVTISVNNPEAAANEYDCQSHSIELGQPPVMCAHSGPGGQPYIVACCIGIDCTTSFGTYAKRMCTTVVPPYKFAADAYKVSGAGGFDGVYVKKEKSEFSRTYSATFIYQKDGCYNTNCEKLFSDDKSRSWVISITLDSGGKFLYCPCGFRVSSRMDGWMGTVSMPCYNGWRTIMWHEGIVNPYANMRVVSYAAPTPVPFPTPSPAPAHRRRADTRRRHSSNPPVHSSNQGSSTSSSSIPIVPIIVGTACVFLILGFVYFGRKWKKRESAKIVEMRNSNDHMYQRFEEKDEAS